MFEWHALGNVHVNFFPRAKNPVKESCLDIKKNCCETRGNLKGEDNTNGYVAGNRTPSVLEVHASNLTVSTGYKTGPKNAIAFYVEYSFAFNTMAV